MKLRIVKRKSLRDIIKRKKNDVVVEEVNASMCWELDFKEKT